MKSGRHYDVFSYFKIQDHEHFRSQLICVAGSGNHFFPIFLRFFYLYYYLISGYNWTISNFKFFYHMCFEYSVNSTRIVLNFYINVSLETGMHK